MKIFHIAIFLLFIAIIAAIVLVVAKMPKEPFTELYFENSNDLPKDMALNGTYTFSFTIVSHELETKTYTYTVNSSIKELTNSITLEAGQNKTITVTLEPQIKEAGKLFVSLKNDAESNSSQSIYFNYGVS